MKKEETKAELRKKLDDAESKAAPPVNQPGPTTPARSWRAWVTSVPFKVAAAGVIGWYFGAGVVASGIIAAIIEAVSGVPVK